MGEEVLHVMTEGEEVSGITEVKEGEVIAGRFPLALVGLQTLGFALVVEGEEEEEVVEEVTLLFQDWS